MSVNKVVFGNEVKMDLTNDTVSADNLLEGETAHDRSGSSVVGTAKQGHVILNKIKTALTQRAKLWFKDAKVTDDSTEGATAIEIIHSVTESAFDALPTDGTADGLYELSDGDLTPIMAENVGYDNTTSGSSATDLQDAVDDLYDKKLNKSGGMVSGRVWIDEDVNSANSRLNLGNNKTWGTTGKSIGVLALFGKNSSYGCFYDNEGLTANRDYYLPNKSGMLALTSDVKPVVTRSLSSDSNISCVVTGEHRADMHINLTSQQPSGYSLYRVCMTMAWASGNAWDAAKSEVMGTNLRYYTEGLDVSDIDFVLYRERSLTVGETYIPLNAYWIWAEWLPN